PNRPSPKPPGSPAPPPPSKPLSSGNGPPLWSAGLQPGYGLAAFSLPRSEATLWSATARVALFDVSFTRSQTRPEGPKALECAGHARAFNSAGGVLQTRKEPAW